MTHIWIYTIGSVLLVSLLSLIGIATMSLSKRAMQRLTPVLISLAAGAMLGNALIHLLPEAFEASTSHLTTSLCVLAGIFSFFVLEKFLLWRHCDSHGKCHSADHSDGSEHDHIHPVGYMSLVADGVENLVDGMAIGAAYLVSVPLGVATTVAVVLHEIPTEVGDFGVLLHAGLSRGKALFYNFLSGFFAVVGAVLALTAGAAVDNFPAFMAPFAAGCFIYLAATGLVPQMHKEVRPSHSFAQVLAMALGVALMAALTFIA